MGIKKPASFSAGRKIVINGTVYQPGANVPNAVVKGLVRLSALLNKRAIVPNLDPHGRKTKAATPSPTDLHPSMKKTL